MRPHFLHRLSVLRADFHRALTSSSVTNSTPNNLGTVKKLHGVLFPISYSPQFYSALLSPAEHPEDYNKLVFYQDLPVGVVVCRLEEEGGEVPRTLGEAAAGGKGKDVERERGEAQKEDEGKTYRLYVMTLGVLACVFFPLVLSSFARGTFIHGG